MVVGLRLPGYQELTFKGRKMARISYDGVWKRFPDGTEAVRDFSLDIHDGEFLVLVGPSGCGKSTVLRMTAGLEEISEGLIAVDNTITNDLGPRERDVAMVFQSYALYPHMSVEENIGFPLKIGKLPKAEIQSRTREAAAVLQLTEYLHRKPRELSGGQRQRVAMGRAMVREPSAFLMDEPLSNLDAKLRVQMRAEIVDMHRRTGVTTLYVTHDQIEAMTMADRVAVMQQGVLQQVAPPQELYERPRNLFVATFIGSPTMNVARAPVKSDNGTLSVELPDTATLRIPQEALHAYPRVAEYVGKEVAVGLRPEFFITGEDILEDRRIPEVKVKHLELLGSEALVYFETATSPVVTDDTRAGLEDVIEYESMIRDLEVGGQTFAAKIAPHDAPDPGDTFDIGFATERMHFFDIVSGDALR